MINYNPNLKTLQMLIAFSQKLTMNREFTEEIDTNNRIIFITSFLIESGKMNDIDRQAHTKLSVNTVKCNASLIKKCKNIELFLKLSNVNVHVQQEQTQSEISDQIYSKR